MIAIGLMAASAAATVLPGAERLAYESSWHCSSVGLAESYSLDFVVSHASEHSSAKKRFSIVKVVGQISLPEQVLDGQEKVENNDYYSQADADKNPYYIHQQYILRAGGYKTSAMFSWKSKEPEILLDLVVFDWEKKRVGQQYETRYGLSCKQSGIAT